MLDQIIENIIQKIRKEVVQPGMEDIPLTYLFTRNIPESIKHFFDQEVELWIREEYEKFTNSERFNYDLPEVQMLLDKIFDTLKQTATFSLNQFNLLLERAIKLQANFLIRPQKTLTQFLFKDAPVITTIQVHDMLKYFNEFTYYHKALTDFFNIKYLREISFKQFQEVIAAIDRQMFTKSPVATAMHVVEVINNFINEGRMQPSDKISTHIILMAFEDRQLDDFSMVVKKEINKGVTSLSLKELEKLLKNSLGGSAAVTPLETAANSLAVDEIEVVEAEIPATETEEPKDAYEEEMDEREAVAQPKEKSTNTAAEQLASIVAEKIKADQLADLNNMIGRWQRRKFIKKLFRKNEKEYESFIQLLNRTPTWKEASNVIDSYFYENGLNPYAKESLEFTDLVYTRFFPKDDTFQKKENSHF
jgi:hypothetical protein